MTKEEYLKKLILQRWTLKDFAAKINMPYGTLYSILKNVDGGSMYNIVKICSGLHISTNELSQIGKPRNYILQEDRSTYNTKELPDLRSILSSTLDLPDAFIPKRTAAFINLYFGVWIKLSSKRVFVIRV